MTSFTGVVKLLAEVDALIAIALMSSSSQTIQATPTAGVERVVGDSAESRLVRWFCLLTGLAKVLSTLGINRVLDVADTVLGLKFRHLGIAATSLGFLNCVLAMRRRRPKQLPWIQAGLGHGRWMLKSLEGRKLRHGAPHMIGLVMALLTWSQVALSPVTAHAADFEVEGNIQSVDLRPHNQPSVPVENSFLVRVAGERWYIRVDDLAAAAGTRTNVHRTELVCDGQDVYHLSHYPENLAALASATTTNRLYGSVRKGAWPPTTSGTVQRLLWLAFCSAEHLGTNASPASIRDPGNADRQPLWSAWQLAERSKLPTHFDQACPGCAVKRQGTNAILVPYQAPFDQGWVDFEYRVTAMTNAGELSVPAAFFAGFYLPLNQAGTGLVRTCVSSWTGRVSRAGDLLEPIRPPELVDSANVVDHRFRTKTGSPLVYTEQRGSNWLNRSDSAVLDVVRRQRTGSRADAAVMSPTRRLVVTSLVVVALLGTSISALIFMRHTGRTAGDNKFKQHRIL